MSEQQRKNYRLTVGLETGSMLDAFTAGHKVAQLLDRAVSVQLCERDWHVGTVMPNGEVLVIQEMEDNDPAQPARGGDAT